MNAVSAPEIILRGGDPIDRQLQDQIRGCILSGSLRPGEELPTARQAAVGLAVNLRTVQRAYGRLEREGFLNSEDGSGTFVAAPHRVRRAARARRNRLGRVCGRFLDWCEKQGYPVRDVVGTLNQLIQGEVCHGRED